jgi:hypothetical protein
MSITDIRREATAIELIDLVTDERMTVKDARGTMCSDRSARCRGYVGKH